MTSNKSSFNFRTLFSKRKENSKVNVNSNEPELNPVTSQEKVDRRRSVRQYPAKGTKILIVEDSKTVQAVLSKIFIQAGFDVLQAYDGASGVTQAKEHRPSLIMMDVVMPGMTGFQATRAIRKNDETAETPIIIMSGNKQATEQFWAKKIGANAYMNKPFSRADLFAVLEQHMHQNSSLPIAESDGSTEYIQPDEAYEYQKWFDI